LLRTENHAQANDIAAWSSGAHLVKFGVNVPDWSRRGMDDTSNFGGTFFFSSLADYAAQLPYAFRQQQGSGHVVFWQKELGGFLQDDYRVSHSLSLSLGVRYNWQNYLRDNNNFAPRLAFAYAPGKSHRTVLRGGAGVFYDRTGAGPIGDLLRYNGQVLRSVLITNPGYPNPFLFAGALQAQPSDIVRFDPTIREPYSVQYSMGIEEQVAKRTTIAATYRGAVGVKLFRSRDVNAPPGPDYLVNPDPAIGVWRQIESSGRQLDNALDLTLRGEVTRHFTGVAQYTLSRSSNNTGGIAWFPANQYNPTGEWGRADFDQRNRLNLLGTFNSGRWLNLGIGLALASGKPYSLTTGQDFYDTGLVNARPDGVPRNSLEGPGYADLDLRWSHNFYFNRAKKDKGPAGTFAFDAFNVLNRVNYLGYIGNLSSPFFGQAVASQPARRLQLTVRLTF
jgi:outer membrane receptor protein involved in Fe transport